MRGSTKDFEEALKLQSNDEAIKKKLAGMKQKVKERQAKERHFVALLRI